MFADDNELTIILKVARLPTQKSSRVPIAGGPIRSGNVFQHERCEDNLKPVTPGVMNKMK